VVANVQRQVDARRAQLRSWQHEAQAAVPKMAQAVRGVWLHVRRASPADSGSLGVPRAELTQTGLASPAHSRVSLALSSEQKHTLSASQAVALSLGAGDVAMGGAGSSENRGSSNRGDTDSGGKGDRSHRDPDESKSSLLKKTNLPLPHLVAGCLSAVVSRTAVAPLERIKMDMILNHRTGNILTGISQLARKEGILSLWKGNGINLMRVCPHRALNFYSFTVYSNMFAAIGNKPMPSQLETFFSGALAGITASVICFPADMVRTRILGKDGSQYKGIINAYRKIIRDEGFRYMFRASAQSGGLSNPSWALC